MRRRTSHHYSFEEEGQINLTPLIDVVFVVLIMFIIVVPILETDHIDLAKGNSSLEKQTAQIEAASPIIIHVYEDNQIRFNNKQIAKSELRAALKAAKQAYPQAIPQLFHHRKAYFETYQEIKTAVEEEGFAQMDLVLQPG